MIYYYASDNITESRLAFRHAVHCDDFGAEMNYEQNDHRALETIYGFQNDGEGLQTLGSVLTRQGRLVAFPNTKQHRVEPFSLADRSRPGHRKILALFLVDPGNRVISTANVLCQQKEWWEEQIKAVGSARSKLPQEMKDHIAELVDFPVSLETAKKQRLKLMSERSNFTVILLRLLFRYVNISLLLLIKLVGQQQKERQKQGSLWNRWCLQRMPAR